MSGILIIVVCCFILSGFSIFGFQLYRQKDVANFFKKNSNNSKRQLERINELETLLKKEKSKVKKIEKELKIIKEQCEI
jgi:hypothetical protein